MGTIYNYHCYCDYSFQLFLLIVLIFLVPTSLPDSRRGSIMFLNRAAEEAILLDKTCGHKQSVPKKNIDFNIEI